MHKNKDLHCLFKKPSSYVILKALLVVMLRLKAIAVLNYLSNVYNHRYSDVVS